MASATRGGCTPRGVGKARPENRSTTSARGEEIRFGDECGGYARSSGLAGGVNSSSELTVEGRYAADRGGGRGLVVREEKLWEGGEFG